MGRPELPQLDRKQQEEEKERSEEEEEEEENEADEEDNEEEKRLDRGVNELLEAWRSEQGKSPGQKRQGKS